MSQIPSLGDLEDYQSPADAYFSENEPERMLLLADTHYKEDKFFEDKPLKSDLNKLEEIGDIFEIDEIVWAGDCTYSPGDIIDFKNSDFSKKRVVMGNHDREDDAWSFEEVFGETLPELDDIDYEKYETVWSIGKDRKYDVCMRHESQGMGLSPTGRGSPYQKYNEFDILIHGHRHIPYYRVLDNRKMGVGLGSLFSNYTEDRTIPRRSIQIMEVDGVIDVKHIDFDEMSVVEEIVFGEENGVFGMLEKWGRGAQEIFS
ncbi:MAG: metallophosphoesterase family protein [Candidatus Aenigmatarchaeota archaeon]